MDELNYCGKDISIIKEKHINLLDGSLCADLPNNGVTRSIRLHVHMNVLETCY